MANRLDWQNGHLIEPEPDDIWFITNGYDYREGNFKKVSWYAESVNYLRNEYQNFNTDVRWDLRFHFNPNYQFGNSKQQLLGCWWFDELNDYLIAKKNKSIVFEFGMTHGHKPSSSHLYDYGWLRSEIVKECRNHSFCYYGSGWDNNDPNYKGEVYMSDKNTPEKFRDARKLMAPMKFVFCAENIHDKWYSTNYLTEKIFHGFLSYSVPIYIGCWNVEELIDKSLYIDFRDFKYKIKDIINYCEHMPDSEYHGYLDRIEEFLHNKAKVFTFENRLLEVDAKIRENYK